MKKSLLLLKQKTEKREKAKALLAKTDATEAEIKEADSLIVEIENDEIEYDAQVKREQFESANETALNEAKNTPVNGLPHPQSKDSGVQGFERDGEVVVDLKTQKVLEESGFGISEKQMGAISTKSYRDAFVNMLRKKGEFNLGSTDLKSLAEGTDSAGGFLVPAQFLAQMIERERAMGSLGSQVTNLQTSSDKLIIPKNTYSASDKYTTGVRVEWTDEEAELTEQNAKNFGNVTIPVHTAMLYHDVTNNMLEDSAFDILRWLQMKFSETSDVVDEDLIINGDGQGKPSGILLNAGGANAPAVVNSGHATQLTADGLIDLAWTMPSRYNRNSRFVFNRTSAGRAIAKLKDGDDRYLFAAGVNSDGLATARPQSLLGYPIEENDFMPDVAANAFPVIFGDLKGYYKVNRVGFSIQILREIVATHNKVRLLGRKRIGGQVCEDWKIRVQKISA